MNKKDWKIAPPGTRCDRRVERTKTWVSNSLGSTYWPKCGNKGFAQHKLWDSIRCKKHAKEEGIEP